MSRPEFTPLRVDRYVLADIASDKAVLEVLLHVSSFLFAGSGIRNLDALLTRLLERIFEFIPADSGVVSLNGQPAAFRGSPFEVDPDVARRAIEEHEAQLRRHPTSLLCAPLRLFDTDLGLICLVASKPDAFSLHHLRLLIAIASVSAVAVDHSRHIARLEDENQELREYNDLDHDLVGDSPPMRAARSLIEKVADSDSTVLILGESGTGKEVVARAIHRKSRRKEKTFSPVNCAALVDTLIESELFGHERGAFTGAVKEKKGKVEVADGGTLFLDEIGELSLQTQAALLRFLQEREFQRVGGTQTHYADVRVVAATNRNLKDWVDAGRFRADLYYRLQVVEIHTPSLREVRGDIPRLAQHFVERFRYVRVVEGISDEALAIITRYDWPGNVRQLQNAIEPDDLPKSVTEAKQPKAASAYSSVLQQSKKEMIERALREAGGNQTEAARALNITTRYLRRLVRDLGINPP
jgi:transcriptional regulator with GAF, ATPase, and Fis domain